MTTSKDDDRADRRFMRRALILAARGAGTTRPNPPVGAVIVKNGCVIAEGWHRASGQPHAEAAALDAAGKRARGADLFVTLEPCSTTGRTGACTDRILEAGIRRVVVAVADPNPVHAGRGMRLLQANGLTVDLGCEHERATEYLAPFAKWITQGIPRLTLKLAMSLDGKIADRTGRSRWISSPASRRCVQELRRIADAILIGADTARRDRPCLLPTAAGRRTWRVIVDSRGNIDPLAPVFRDDYRSQTILATTAACPPRRHHDLEQNGITVWRLPTCAGRVSVRSLMRRLGRLNVMQVLCEGGGELAASLVSAKLVDEYYFFIAPRLLGGKHAPGALGGNGFLLGHDPALEFVTSKRFGPDMLIRARPAEKQSGIPSP